MISRRHFLWGGAAAVGGLSVGFSIRPLRAIATRLRDVPILGNPGWIHISADNIVTIHSTLTEMGQGVWTTLAQLVCEELDAKWSTLRVSMAPSWRGYYQPIGFATGGSSSTQRMYGSMRAIATTARTMLVMEASHRWNVPAASCDTENGDVVHQASGRRASFGELADDAARHTPASTPLRKSKRSKGYIGQSLPRLDTDSKVNGSAIYGVDVRLPDMRVAAISQSPFIGCALAAVDREAALSKTGVERVIVLDDTVAVLASNFWQASRGLEAARVQWKLPDPSLTGTVALRERLKNTVETHLSPLQSGNETVAATYSVPLLRHAQLEPINATARATRFDAEIWTSTQAQQMMQVDVGKALGLWPHLVTVHSTLVGGGFGRRLATDYGVTAARVAREFGGAVQCIWSREEDSGQARHRTMAAAHLRASLDTHGAPTAVEAHVAAIGADAHIGGLGVLPYAIDPPHVRYSGIDVPIRIGSWRSVDASQNVFFLESFIDECAYAAQQDPLEYRLKLLEHDPRAKRVLTTIGTMSKWKQGGESGRYCGVAFHNGCGSLTAQVVEVSRDSSGLRIERVYAVVDCGIAIHPDNIRAQLEGGILFGLSAALSEEVTIANGTYQSLNFDQYKVLRIGNAPIIEVQILETPDAPLGGIGEVGVPLIAPALANAVFAATGTRVRDLPFAGGANIRFR